MLTDSEIYNSIADGSIVIRPFRRSNLGSNSYDLHLGGYIREFIGEVIDPKEPVEDQFVLNQIPESGYILQPNTLYLGSTLEYTETHKHIPCIEGKSSLARLGLFVHITAGFGDVGYCGNWTLELMTIHPLIIYPGMPIAQIYYHTITGEVMVPYNQKSSAKYNNVGTEIPAVSKAYKGF